MKIDTSHEVVEYKTGEKEAMHVMLVVNAGTIPDRICWGNWLTAVQFSQEQILHFAQNDIRSCPAVLCNEALFFPSKIIRDNSSNS